MAAPGVAGEEAAMEGVFLARENFEGLRNFQRGDEINYRADDPDSVAGFIEALADTEFEEAGEARSDAGTDDHSEAITADACGVDPGAGKFHGEIVDEETRFEIVGSIEDEIEASEKFFNVIRAEIGDQAFNGNGGVDGVEFAFSGDGFGESVASVGFVEERLTLKIGRLDEIAINDSNAANAGTDEKICGGRADGAAADDGGAGGEQTLLALRTDARKKDLAGVFFLESVVH
jgi:hypothetical protein